MMKKTYTIIISVLVILLFSLLWAGTTETVKRERAVLRQGPGSFFPAVAELAQGTSVEVRDQTDGWLKVTVEELSGYISSKAVEGQTKKQDPFAQLSEKTSVTRVSRSGVSAAVKGFAERFATRLDGDTSFLDVLYSYHMDPAAYQRFREETYRRRNLRAIRRRVNIPRKKVPEVFSFSEEGVGLAIATKVAELGIYSNKPVQDYVNYVGNLVVEATDAYDIGFKFFILDSDKVNAYSCPGGIVFVSRGALQRMDNEAELACFLGHEVAHVVLRHGMREMEKRRPMVTADNAFMDLDNQVQMSPEMQAANQDLESMALDAYETIFHGRLEGYEEEADTYGMIYAARAGYNPQAMATYLAKLSRGGQLSGNEHYTPQQNTKRLTTVKKWLQHERMPNRLLEYNADRFHRWVHTL